MSNLHEECGVFGVYSPKPGPVADLAYYGRGAFKTRLRDDISDYLGVARRVEDSAVELELAAKLIGVAEISVVGESQRTASYVGIKVDKVIMRTILLSGAICGFTGWMMVSGIDHTITTTLAGGRGFLGIMVSWLAQFNVAAMIFALLSWFITMYFVFK